MKRKYNFGLPIFLIFAAFTILTSFIRNRNEKIDVFLVGDSTVKNGQGDGAGGLWGWGDPLKYHFDTTRVNIENHALGGTSSRSFQTGGLWQKVLDKVGSGDYVFIQFGHNDNGSYNTDRARGTIKGTGNDTVHVIMESTGNREIIYTYGWYLRKYIADTRAKGGIPVIVSPIPRNDWENGKIKYNDPDYSRWAREVASSEKVAFIDLNAKMTSFLNNLGESNVTGKYFFARDHTHTTAEGAILNARLVAQGILEIKGCKLAKYVIENPVYNFPVKIRVFTIGDSTVAKGKDGIQGWGAEIDKYFDSTRVMVVNKARGGRSSRTYMYEGIWHETLKEIKPGDYVLVQFGHNDGGAIDKEKMRGSIKGTGTDSIIVQREDGKTEIVHSYGWYLTKYIKDAKALGATPIVCSPIPRREWTENKIIRASEDYGKWAKEVAEKENVCFIDLNEIVALKYEALGQDTVAAEFFLEDHTHTTAKGADLNAQSVVEGLKDKKCKLRNYLAY